MNARNKGNKMTTEQLLESYDETCAVIQIASPVYADGDAPRELRDEALVILVQARNNMIALRHLIADSDMEDVKKMGLVSAARGMIEALSVVS